MTENGDINSFSQTVYQLHRALGYECFTASEGKLLKRDFQKLYTKLAHTFDNKLFLNLGLWDKVIYHEYRDLKCNFSSLCPHQDIYSQTLLYYQIRPLIIRQFFNKRLLDIGCGNGIGLKLSAILLDTKHALGIDLVNKLVSNANTNFYQENRVHYIQSDAENLPLGNESVDIVTNLESSHLYPNIEHFFLEVERILSPGGFFCYSDILFNNKQQAKRLEVFIKKHNTLKIIIKQDITKRVQASIYQRLIVNEDSIYKNASALFNSDKERVFTELPSLFGVSGLTFLPWWKIRFKNPALKPIANYFRKNNWSWGKKHYFYYLVQKNSEN